MCSCATTGPDVFDKTIAVGPWVDPLEDCDLHVADELPAAERRSLHPVGFVCIAGLDGEGHLIRSTEQVDDEPTAFELLRNDACDLGGDVVVPLGTCTVGRRAFQGRGITVIPVDGIEYHVFRRGGGTARSSPRGRL